MAATSRSLSTARLAMALASAGCKVEAVCPPQHALRMTNAVLRAHKYYGLAPLMSFSNAIDTAAPHLIVPGDDLSTRHLRHLYLQERGRGKKGSQICALIERSFGSPESFSIVYERATFMEVAEEEGVRAPKTAAIANLHELRRWISAMGLPVVLKTDGTSGGDGVRIVRSLEEAERAFRKLQAPALLARAAKRAVVDHDRTLVWPSLLRRRSTVNAQVFVEGHEATSTVACWQGAVMASLHFEVISKMYAAGPATVVRLIQNDDMTAAVEKMVRRLNLSGLHGFDFMLETRTGSAHLIEINPRTTQVGHLTLGVDRDLPAALIAAIKGSDVRLAPKLTENNTIALFPQEWLRDHESPFLQSAYHDVPWEEPELIGACIRQARRNRSGAQQRWNQTVSQPAQIACDLSPARRPHKRLTEPWYE